VDLPGGGGKILLHEGVIAGMQEDQRGAFYLLKDRNGTCWPYPVL
jgi:hypothetical protein